MKEFEFLKYAHDEITKCIVGLTFDKKHPYHFLLVALHGSTIELSKSIILLLENGCFTGVPSVLRTLLETIVELKNLAQDQTYGYNMDVIYYDSHLQLLKRAKQGNPYLKGIDKELELNTEITKYRKKRDDLKCEGFEKLNPAQRFKKAGMTDEYNSIYSSLSSDSHCNKSALIGRHFEQSSDTDFNIVLFKDQSKNSYISEIGIVIEILMESAVILHTVLDSKNIDEIIQLDKKYDAMKKAAISELLTKKDEV